MGVIDLVIVLSYVGYAIYTAVTSSDESSENLEEYFLAGRTLKGWQAGVSMAATQFAADTPLLVTGLIATAGVFSLWRLWIYALAFLLLGFLLSGAWRRAGVITDAELTELRYGKKPALVLRGFKAIYLGTIFNCTVLAMVMLAATRIAEPFLKWHNWLPDWIYNPFLNLVQWVGTPLTVTTTLGDSGVWLASADNLISILVLAMITMTYSTSGGLRNVIKMDIFQFTLMMVSTFLFAWFVVENAGGLGGISDSIRTMFAEQGPFGMTPDQILAFTPNEAAGVSSGLLVLFAIQWIAQINSDGTGYLAQRTMACQSESEAKIAALVFTIAQIFVRSLLWLVIGLALLVVFVPDLSLDPNILKAEREATYIRGIVELMPPGLIGLLITGMLAALGSTVDTHLNWGSSYWTNDIFKRIICEEILHKDPDPKLLVWVARFANFVILFLALFIMSQLSSIQEAWKISLLLGAGLGVLLVLRWVWWRINAWGEIATIVTSLAMSPFLLYHFDETQDAERLILLTVVATSAGIILSLLTGPEDNATLDEFYNRVKPPGFWGPVAERNGDEKATIQSLMWRRLGAVFACAGSIFLLLIGIGSWMIDSPAPNFLPNSALWITICMLGGLGLIPVWRKLGWD